MVECAVKVGAKCSCHAPRPMGRIGKKRLGPTDQAVAPYAAEATSVNQRDRGIYSNRRRTMPQTPRNGNYRLGDATTRRDGRGRSGAKL